MGSGSPAETAAHVAAIEEQGYTVLERAIDDETRLALLDDLRRIEQDQHIVPAGNRFEGSATTRVYNLLAHGPLWHPVPVHPQALHIGAGCCLAVLLARILWHRFGADEPIDAESSVAQSGDDLLVGPGPGAP